MNEAERAAASSLQEVLPKSGLVYSERGGLAEILCKPKILPLKSAVLEQLQRIEREADGKDDDDDRATTGAAADTYRK